MCYRCEIISLLPDEMNESEFIGLFMSILTAFDLPPDEAEELLTSTIKHYNAFQKGPLQ